MYFNSIKPITKKDYYIFTLNSSECKRYNFLLELPDHMIDVMFRMVFCNEGRILIRIIIK